MRPASTAQNAFKLSGRTKNTVNYPHQRTESVNELDVFVSCLFLVYEVQSELSSPLSGETFCWIPTSTPEPASGEQNREPPCLT